MLCVSCNKREATVRVGGRQLCPLCARDEIQSRVRSVLHRSGALGWRKTVTLVVPSEWLPLKDVLSLLVKRSCLTCEMNLEVREVNYESFEDLIWDLIDLSISLGRPVITPFTAEFYVSYSLYSMISGDKDYLLFSPPIYEYSGSKVVSPLSSSTLAELEAFGHFSISFRDPLFDEIFRWALSYLADSPEQARAFWKSYSLFEGNRCKRCGALIPEGLELCHRCSRA